jgi:hypothetical protein
MRENHAKRIGKTLAKKVKTEPRGQGSVAAEIIDLT